jgi:outer membrane protein
MKKLPLILALASLAGVIILAILFFTSNTKADNSKEGVEEIGNKELKIAYILTDSVLVNYQLAIDLHQEFLAQQQQYNNEFSKKRQNLENQAVSFQEKLQRGGFLTEDRAIKERDRILGMEEEMKRMDYELSSKLGQMEASINQRLADSIISYVKEYNAEMNYTYIFSNTGTIIVGDQQHNISKQVLDGLNARYALTKK